MATAVMILDKVPGYPGLARVYKLDPPLVYDNQEREYALIWVPQPSPHVDVTVSVIPSTRTGVPIEGSMRARPGTFVAHGNPFARPDYLEGCFAWALAGAGQAAVLGAGSGEGYTIAQGEV
ncbi:hypothetical protein IU459_11710 [Nocardia amamiensis]|uniref:Uncharacterized protein n=1 Tax=Nocardia amamiensis TaxID=404578 RepID=A0ABS0CNU3_9NOCA|nr:hypothetical protein [Nocardia amamiensis]MBF6298206.1 hypothetical protein [Nocardia amamiensis]